MSWQCNDDMSPVSENELALARPHESWGSPHPERSESRTSPTSSWWPCRGRSPSFTIMRSLNMNIDICFCYCFLLTMYSSRSRERCTVEVERNQETDTQYHFTSLNRATNAFNQNKEWEWMFEGHYKGMVKWHCKYIYRTEIKACGLDWHITWSMDFQPNSE